MTPVLPGPDGYFIVFVEGWGPVLKAARPFHRPVKLFSDIDDTLFANYHDASLPSGNVYVTQGGSARRGGGRGCKLEELATSVFLELHPKPRLCLSRVVVERPSLNFNHEGSSGAPPPRLSLWLCISAAGTRACLPSTTRSSLPTDARSQGPLMAVSLCL